MRLLTLAALLAATVAPVSAQRLEFANARYASYSSLTLYAGYNAGPGLVFVGVLQNPRSSYREALVGVAKPLGRAGRAVLVGTALATTSDGEYAQLYVLPTLAMGPVTIDATTAFQKPMGGGPVEMSVSPANAFLSLDDTWRVGATWALSATFGRQHNQALGPAVMRVVPGGSVGLHVLHGLNERPDEVWLTAKVTP